jgi:hypothetical protein
MEDFRHISRLAEIHGEQRREVERARRDANLLPSAPQFNLRRVIVSLTVVILGMLAWWGQ